MVTLNRKIKSKPVKTHERAPAVRLNAEKMLRRSLMSCMLWEKEFYEDGNTIADRLCELVPQVKPEKVAAMMIEARSDMHLRHAPLLIACALAKDGNLKADDLNAIIQRADELTEFLAVYWRDERCKLANQVKKGLAKAFPKFSEYALAKYNRDKAVKLRDVMFLCHPKPTSKAQAKVWKKLAEGTLEAPDTWEVALSASKGKDKTAHWERLLKENKLGGMALLRNLRNMKDASVKRSLIEKALAEMNTNRILPFRFIAAARHAPQWESFIEAAMLRSLQEGSKLKGHTIILVDVSASMDWELSTRSDMNRMDAACGLAICGREMYESVDIYSFSLKCKQVASRHGFALRDAIVNSQSHSGTYLGAAVQEMNAEGYDRMIVITDEQSHDAVPAPKGRGYMLNVASARNGVGYGKWLHVDGWSDSVLQYIAELEHVNGY